MYFIGYGCTFIPGPASFRTAWGIQFVPAFFMIVGLPFLPESPRWLAMKDRGEEAINVLAKIQAGGNTNDPLVVAEWEEITEVLRLERQSGNIWQKFTANGMWKRTLAGFTVQMWQQNAGANVCGSSAHLFLFDAYSFSAGHDLLCGVHFLDGEPVW